MEYAVGNFGGCVEFLQFAGLEEHEAMSYAQLDVWVVILLRGAMGAMTLSELIRAMAAVGATPEAIAIAVDFIEEQSAALDARRTADRERKRKQRSRDIPGTVTGHSADSHGTIPPPKEIPPTPPKEITPPLPLASLEGKPTRAREEPRKTSLREDAQPTEGDRRIAEDAGMSQTEFREEWRAFRDHHCSRGNTMKNWHLAWSTWVRNNRRFKARAGPSAAPTKSVKMNPFLRDYLERQAENGKAREYCDSNGRDDEDGTESTVIDGHLHPHCRVRSTLS